MEERLIKVVINGEEGTMMVPAHIGKTFRHKLVNIITSEKNRRVVAYVTDCRLDAIETILKNTFLSYMGVTDAGVDASLAELRCAGMLKTYRSVLKCHPEDVYNEDKGIQMALERLHGKYQKAIQKAIRRFQKRQTDSLENIIADI